LPLPSPSRASIVAPLFGDKTFDRCPENGNNSMGCGGASREPAHFVCLSAEPGSNDA
jgi:hypothetical protein